MTFHDLTPSYTGAPVWPQVRLGGQPRAATFQCRRIDPAAAPAVFSNLPTVLALSYNSLGFAATQTSALGNLVRLAGTPRVADHAEVVMVTWATAEKYPALAAADPSGYRHPVTATLYEIKTSSDGAVTLLPLEQSTVQVQIPWRPAKLPNGDRYPYNGYAVKVLVPFSGKVSVPAECLIAIGFDTQNSGASPLPVNGPYNELNLALGTAAPKVGADVSSDEVFWVKTGQWHYPAKNWGGFGSPLLSLGTRAIPLPSPELTSEAPLHAGTYHVEATVAPEGTVAGAVMTLAKKALSLETAGLTKSIADVDPFITVTNPSPGLEVAIRYGGSPQPPTKPGHYPFTIAVTDPNHTGSLAGDFHLTGLSYAQWSEREIRPGESTDPTADAPPDWLAYAVGGTPGQASQPLRLDATPGGMQVSFTQRREMPELRLRLESSTDLANWQPVATLSVEADDFWETSSATSGEASAYFRLRADVE